MTVTQVCERLQSSDVNYGRLRVQKVPWVDCYPRLSERGESRMKSSILLAVSCVLPSWWDGCCKLFCRWWEFKKRKKKGWGWEEEQVKKGDGRVSPLRVEGRQGSLGARGPASARSAVRRGKFFEKRKGKRKITWGRDVKKEHEGEPKKYLIPQPESQFSPFDELNYVIKSKK